MIYEVRTYTLKPGGTPQFEANFAEALPHRVKYSRWPLSGIRTSAR